MTKSLDCELRIGGHIRNSSAYGVDYLSEFRRIILSHVRPRTRAFLEWGMGLTTLAVLQMREELGLEAFISVDNNQAYLSEVMPQLPAWSGFEAHCRDLRGPSKSDRDPELNYSTLPLSWGRKFDFIYIDGRRRIECAFIASLLCHEDTIVALHDYRRGRYQPILALYELVEDGPQYRVMRLRR